MNLLNKIFIIFLIIFYLLFLFIAYKNTAYSTTINSEINGINIGEVVNNIPIEGDKSGKNLKDTMNDLLGTKDNEGLIYLFSFFGIMMILSNGYVIYRRLSKK